MAPRIASVIGAFLVVLSSCAAEPTPADSNPPAEEADSGPAFGFALSPRSYEGNDLPEFLDLIDDHADVLMHAGDWADLESASGPFHVMSALADQRGLDTLVVVSPSKAAELIRPLDDPTRTDYLTWLRAFLEQHQPEYLGLANEVNMLALEDPDGFDEVVALWDEARPIVRELAPDTQVFITFQFERTVGRHDGWFGGSVVEPDWSPIDRFDDMDAVAFTTYPSLVHDTVEELPEDYYTQIAEHTDLPVIFTEIGWTADNALQILPGSEDEQVAYLDLLEEQTTALPTDVYIWPFVHDDLITDLPFSEIDLIRDDDSPRPAWDRWLALDR